MHIGQLYLRNFRNYREETFRFSPHLNLIHGKNGQGKTNLLEALFLLGTGRSFRTSFLRETIRQGASFFFLEALFMKEGIEQRVALSFDGETKKLEMNHTTYSHFNPLLGLVPIVLLAPEDVQLVSGTPSDRRRFLDLHLAQSDPLYVFHLTRYHQALKQRNVLLRQKQEEGLGPWEQLLLAAARYIQEKRRLFLEEIREELLPLMQTISNHHDQIDLRYVPSVTESYLHQRPKELLLGSTLLGPHRDDLEIRINRLPAAGYASQGQIRCAVAALRLAEWKHLAQQHALSPLFCVDDFGVHLDAPRRDALLHHLGSFGQVFLTSPLPVDNPLYQTFQVEAGAWVHPP